MCSFLVSSYYRGSMNISNMRLFEDPTDAWDHACWCLDEMMESDTRIYMVSEDNSPLMVKIRPHYSRKGDRAAEKAEMLVPFLEEIVIKTKELTGK